LQFLSKRILFWIDFLTGSIVAIGFFQYKFKNHIFGKKSQTVYPKQIDIEVWFVIESIEQHWIPDKDKILDIVEKKYSCPIKLLKDSQLGSTPARACLTFSCAIEIFHSGSQTTSTSTSPTPRIFSTASLTHWVII